MLTAIALPDVADVHTVAELLGATVRHARRVVGTHGFPEPARLAGNGVRLWRIEDVRRWLDEQKLNRARTEADYV